MSENRIHCPECGDDDLTRRDFLRTAGAAALAAGAAPVFATPRPASAGASRKGDPETAVKRFYETLTGDQKKVICFAFDNPLRTRISANWRITKPAIEEKFYTDEQRKLMDEIFRGITSGDGYERFLKQMDEDDDGFGSYHVAVFGTPGSGKFEWEMTGRHLTVRANGDSADHLAFGGPIVYGHGASNPKENLFHYQTKKANEVFKALDPAQAKKALVEVPPPESKVPLQGEGGRFPGIAVGELTSDQKALVESVLKVNLAPYREADVEEAMKVLKAGGGLDKLHLAFYKAGDLRKDGVWDVWRVEGPSFVWHFRGAPHVHAYANIGVKKA